MGLRLLNTSSEKLALLGSLGIDRVEQIEFTMEFSQMSTLEYLRDFLIGKYNASAILLGYDNRIGHDNLTPEATAALAESLGLEVIRTEKVSSVGIAVSSTKIRNALKAGDVALASTYLCYDYNITGEVVHGKKLGRTIGYPTANIEPDEPLKLVPALGVYLSQVQIGDRSFYGMTNIGQGMETHIFDFDEDIYGQNIRVSFLQRVRDEIRFDSLEDLKKQLLEDEQSCKNLLNL